MNKFCIAACVSFMVSCDLICASDTNGDFNVRSAVEVTTFEDALESAYANSPGWHAQSIEQNIANEALLQQKMLFLPDIESGLAVSRTNSKMDDHNSAFNGTHNESYFSVNLRQNLFNSFATINNINAADNETKAVFHKINAAEQKMIVDVLDAYSGVWLYRQLVDATKKKAANLLQAFNHQEGNVHAGLGTEADAAQAHANYQKALYEQRDAETKLFAAAAAFEKLTGVRLANNVDLPVLKVDLPIDEEQLIKGAMTNNSNILQSRFSMLSAKDKVAVYIGALGPRCDFSVEMRKHGAYDKNRQPNRTIAANLQVSMPIFANSQNSGNTYSNIYIHKQKLLQAEFGLKDTELEVKKECVTNWNNYLSADSMIEAAKSAVKSAEVSSQCQAEETAVGLKSNTDVLVKENQLLESRIELANSKKQKIMAAIKIMALTGKLSVATLVKGGALPKLRSQVPIIK